MNFVGLLFLSGYNIRKSQRDNWSIHADLACNSFRETMSRNRFDKVKFVFHVADNSFLEKDSRIAKAKPLYDPLNTKIVQSGIVHESLSVD